MKIWSLAVRRAEEIDSLFPAIQFPDAHGKGFRHLLSRMHAVSVMFDSPDENSKGPRHLLYAITDHNLKICIETGSDPTEKY